MLLVLDIDGTLTNCVHRQHHALGGDWDTFHSLMHLDEPQLWVLEVVRALQEIRGDDLETILLTGRPEQYRSETLTWLNNVAAMFEGDEFSELIMRPKDDYRRDVDLKLELLTHWMAELGHHKKEEVLILEDREAVVAMWRDNGFTCFQTAQGAF
jgi:hypothetical protein